MAETKRRFFQLHLSTLIVLMFVAGALVWANVTLQRGNWPSYIDDGYTWGAPPESPPDPNVYPVVWTPKMRGWPEPYRQWFREEPYDVDVLPLLVDVLAAASLIAATAFLCEYLIRRQVASAVSLRTRVIFILLLGSGFGLWWRSEPWVLDRQTAGRRAVSGPDSLPDHREVSVSASGSVVVAAPMLRNVWLPECGDEIRDAHFACDGEEVVCLGKRGTYFWHRRRPEWWWGIAWLPEFWATLLFATALGWSVRRDRRTIHAASQS
jgi:hypothetical protein